MNQLIQYNEEVQLARKNNIPVVALESTIISHGMPYPDNVSMAESVEAIIRAQGAVPATITLYDGKIHIGLTPQLLDVFGQAKQISKASKRDIAYALSMKYAASTTVAATMYCAKLAGIHTFVTGGIGGVHHNASTSFDISADIIELAQTPIAVVSAGAKSILDLAKTLEMLETHSVPVIGYQTDEFPAFYSHTSGIKIPHRMDTLEQVTSFIHCHAQLQQQSGILITNPIPKSAEIPFEDIEPIITQALEESDKVKGKSITPYLLQRINQLSEGKSLLANIELIKNNAQFGANLAIKLAQK